jgi:pyruvate,water dikinase
MLVDNLCWLDQPLQRDLVGDKAFYLGLLRQHPVVPGFVIAAPQLQKFLLRINWPDQRLADLPDASLYVNANQPRQLQGLAQQIRRAILATSLPESLLNDLQQAVAQWSHQESQPAVIFRASLALPAGLDPALSVRTQSLFEPQVCYGDAESLAQGLKQAWAELFRAKSLLYWQQYGIQLPQIRLAVLVQPLWASLAAGTLKIAGNQIEVQAVWGLGQTLELGEADCYKGDLQQGWQPQTVGQKHYVYELRPVAAPVATTAALVRGAANLAGEAWPPEHQAYLALRYLDPARQRQPVLSSEQLQTLASLAQQAQSQLKMPLLLDWLLTSEAAGFHLTQVMPQLGAALHLKASEPLAQVLPPPSSSARLSGLAAAPGRAVAVAWVIDPAALEADWATALEGMPEGAILVTAALTPEQIIRLRQVSGFVTEQGGMTSHAAILARELRIPAVVGVEQARAQIKTGDWLAMDGDLGELYRSSLPFVELPTHWSPQPHLQPASLLLSHPTQTQLWVSLSQLDHLAEAAAAPVQGVGLLRSELMLLDLFGQQHPEVWLQQPAAKLVEQIAERVNQFAAAFAPRPVFYRALDLRAQEFAADAHQLHLLPHLSPYLSPQSMLGVRGAFRMQLHPALLQIELAALKQVQQDSANLSLLLPFVRTVEEFSFCRAQVEQAGLLQADFQIWIMAEVPSVLFLLPDYAAAGLQGIAIGVNDLTQLLLGVDRDQPQMAAAFNPGHPAVRRAIQQLIQTAQSLKLPCSICGQSFRQQPDLLQALLDWQITAVSVDPAELDWVAAAMRQAQSWQD